LPLSVFYLVIFFFSHDLIAKCISTPLIHEEFLSTTIDKKRMTVGQDDVQPVKTKVLEFIKSHPELNVKKVSLTVSAARLPVYREIAGKKVLDPKGDRTNLSLAEARAAFLNQIFKDQVGKYKLLIDSQLSGPKLGPLDLNLRFVTAMTPGYEAKIISLFETHRKEFEEEALLKKSSLLLDQENYPTLFAAKFKPFQGFRIKIEAEKKCKGSSSNAPSSSKQ
jgi:hypothetical protein